MLEFGCWFIEQIDATGINFEYQLSHKCKLSAQRLALDTRQRANIRTTEALYCNNGNKYGWMRPSYESRYSMSVSFKWKISIGKWIVQYPNWFIAYSISLIRRWKVYSIWNLNWTSNTSYNIMYYHCFFIVQ